MLFFAIYNQKKLNIKKNHTVLDHIYILYSEKIHRGVGMVCLSSQQVVVKSLECYLCGENFVRKKNCLTVNSLKINHHTLTLEV
jgi:hypothetical protein